MAPSEHPREAPVDPRLAGPLPRVEHPDPVDRGPLVQEAAAAVGPGLLVHRVRVLHQGQDRQAGVHRARALQEVAEAAVGRRPLPPTPTRRNFSGAFSFF
jgi:hypothetical protein